MVVCGGMASMCSRWTPSAALSCPVTAVQAVLARMCKGGLKMVLLSKQKGKFYWLLEREMKPREMWAGIIQKLDFLCIRIPRANKFPEILEHGHALQTKIKSLHESRGLKSSYTHKSMLHGPVIPLLWTVKSYCSPFLLLQTLPADTEPTEWNPSQCLPAI